MTTRVALSRKEARTLEDWLAAHAQELATSSYNATTLSEHLNQIKVLARSVTSANVKGALVAMDMVLPAGQRYKAASYIQIDKLEERVAELEELFLKLSQDVQNLKAKNGAFRG